MLNLPGSNKTIELIEKIQAKNRELDPECILKDYHKPEKSSFKGWMKFLSIFSNPVKLKKK